MADDIRPHPFNESRQAGIGDVELLEGEPVGRPGVGEVLQLAAGQIVEADHLVSGGEQGVGDMGTDETGRAGNEDAHDEPG